jgi:hypothetical protein
MQKPRIRTDLPPDIANALSDLVQYFRAPDTILRLKNGILTRTESQLVGDAGISKPAHRKDWVTPRRILEVVAQQRGLTLERALLELARSMDLLGTGRYEQLRKAIGEPVVPERNDVPQWNAVTGELSYKGKVVRRVSVRAARVRTVLDAFQCDGWPVHVDSPLPPKKGSYLLRDTVRTINLCTIRFFSDGKGQGISWQEN